MSNEMIVSVVLPAGGNGVRLGSETPKQFIDVLGKPVICYALEAFSSILWVKEIIVPVPSSWRNEAEKLKEKYNYTKVKFIEGSTTRHRSIYLGIQELSHCKENHVENGTSLSVDVENQVVIHDAVRPFLKEDFLKQLCEEATLHQACGSVRALVSTVIESSIDGFMVESLDRRKYRESHTPQAFHYGIIRKAYEKCEDDDFEHGTECLNLVMKHCGISPKLLDGPEYLWKVTYQKDMDLMANYIKDGKI